MSNWFTYEFQAKHFRFEDCAQRRFYTSQWTDNPWVMLVMKGVILAYWLGVFVSSAVLFPFNYWVFLTNWGVVCNLLYFGTSFAFICYGVAHRDEWRKVAAPSSWVAAITTSQTTVPDRREVEKLRWFHILTWMFQSAAFGLALFITVVFWAALDTSTGPNSINVHIMNLVSLLLDLFLVNIPVRLLHFFNLSLLALLYALFSLILYGSGYIANIYPILDWAANPGLAAGLCVVAIFLAPVVDQCVMFGLYHLRCFIARKTVLEEARTKVSATPDGSRDNAAFQPA